MIPGKQYTAQDIATMVWARKWFILLPFVVVAAATIAFAGFLPDRYRAETLILVTSRGVSQDYVRATVTGETVKDRLPSISQQILSRTRLERIVRDLNLYVEERRVKPIEFVVDQMRKDIGDVGVVTGSESFRVGFESSDPVVAMKVTERLAGLFIEENLQDRKLLAEETSDFLESQLADARRRLVEQEKRLEAYRQQHGSELPTQLQSNLQVIQSTQSQLQAIGEAINRDRDRRLLVARQLADLQSEEFLADPAVAVTPGAGVERQPTSVQLEAARAELVSMELRLTAEHPDLIRTRRQVAELEARLRQEATNRPASDAPRPSRPSDIAKRNRIRELQAEVESLDRQTADKTAEQVALSTKLQMYQARVEAVPSRESDLISITRDYDTLQGLYRTLLAKREDSKISENLERRQVGEQFKILDPPHRPERPFGPNRRMIYAGGAIAGFLLGIGLATLLELRDRTVKVDADVHAAVGLPVVAMIPVMATAFETRRARMRQRWQSVAITIVLVVCAAVVWRTVRM